MLKKPRHKGFFVVIEGMDGAGKTNLQKSISLELKKKGFSVVQTREPGGNAISKRIREIIFSSIGDTLDPKTETLLFLASRANNIEKVIKPSLKKNMIVVCDRFNISTLVYQGSIKQKAKKEEVRRITEYVLDGLKPDILIFLDISPNIAYSRLLNRMKEAPNRYDKKGLEFFELLKKEYEKELKNLSENQLVIRVNAETDLMILTKRCVDYIINAMEKS